LSELGLLQEGQHRGLVRRDSRVKPKHDPRVSPAIDIQNLFLVIGIDKQRQTGAIDAKRRLDDIGDVLAVLGLVEIAEIFTAE
jgi:hypothetical protein